MLRRQAHRHALRLVRHLRDSNVVPQTVEVELLSATTVPGQRERVGLGLEVLDVGVTEALPHTLLFRLVEAVELLPVKLQVYQN